LQELKLLQAHNNNPKIHFNAWVIAAAPPEDLSLGYVFRIDVGQDQAFHALLPNIGEHCHIILESDSKISKPLLALRSDGALKLPRSWKDYQEYTVFGLGRLVSIEPCPWASIIKPMLPTKSDPRKLQADIKSAIKVRIELHVSVTTYSAETGSLAMLTTTDDGASFRQRAAFAHLVLPQKIREFVDMSASFPHMRSPALVTDKDLRDNLNRMYHTFDSDQKSAYLRLGRIPDGVFLLPGGAGTGKTRWALCVAAMAQATGTAKVLFLIDINRPLDDTASKMLRLYKELGMQRKVIRMLKWPKERQPEGVKKSRAERQAFNPKIPSLQPQLPARRVEGSDFGSAFIEQWRRAETNLRAKGEFDPLTLDEAVCQYYLEKKENYPQIESFVEESINAQKQGGERVDATPQCQEQIKDIYQIVLQEADFIATTPVAAFCHFEGMFEPDLVFFDECAHARELSTLISIAFFEPKTWFFLGDYRQTSPYVGSDDQQAVQLELSLLERVSGTHNIEADLLTNHRSYGMLHGLPSTLFYDGKMKSCRTGHDNFPESVVYLRDYFNQFRNEKSNRPSSDVPRFIVDTNYDWDLAKKNSKQIHYWNPANHDWVMKVVMDLLNDPRFCQLESSEPGTILIISPYRESFNKYDAAIKRLRSPEKRERVKARTCGNAQGAEADITILDMVKDRASEHSDDPKRLCVALTRARQAQIIMMSPGMCHGYRYYDRERKLWHSFTPTHLPRIWNSCASGEEGSIIDVSHVDDGYES